MSTSLLWFFSIHRPSSSRLTNHCLENEHRFLCTKIHGRGSRELSFENCDPLYCFRVLDPRRKSLEYPDMECRVSYETIDLYRVRRLLIARTLSTVVPRLSTSLPLHDQDVLGLSTTPKARLQSFHPVLMKSLIPSF